MILSEVIKYERVQLTREEALELVQEENRPRYPNIKWYLDAVGIDFTEVINVVNAIPKLK